MGRLRRCSIFFVIFFIFAIIFDKRGFEQHIGPKVDTGNLGRSPIPSPSSTSREEELSIPPIDATWSNFSHRTQSGKCLHSQLSHSQCAELYGRRKLLGAEESFRRLPPLLYSFPGSGNTWARLLIEYATNILTGSLYNDAELALLLPGEFECSPRVSVVKAHPHTHALKDLRAGKFNSEGDKCKKGGIQYFQKAIILLRDPFDSIWSEYQRGSMAGNSALGSHVAGLNKSSFNWTDWRANAARLGFNYFLMWQEQLSVMERNYTGSFLYVKFEDLRDKQKRIHEMTKIRDFVTKGEVKNEDIDLPGACTEAKRASDEHIACAFTLAESPQAHRRVDPTVYMTKDIAFSRFITCSMWLLFGKFARVHGYRPMGFSCPSDQQSSISQQNFFRREFQRHEIRRNQAFIREFLECRMRMQREAVALRTRPSFEACQKLKNASKNEPTDERTNQPTNRSRHPASLLASRP